MTEQGQLTSIALVFLVLRAFSGGCSAMTGTEAISNGVPAFKPPESRNAAVTLGIMAAILGVFLVGVTHLAQVLHLTPMPTDTVLSQVGRAVYGNGGFLYYALQIATMAILFLGANTSFAGLPPSLLDPGPRRAHAPAVHEPRRQVGVLQRHHRPGRRSP